MAEFLLRHGTWLAVCDGKKALLLENTGDRLDPKLETRAVFEHENPPTHEQGTAPPGRTFSSVNGRRGAVEQTDFHDQAERAFLRRFAGQLAQLASQHGIHRLYVIAPARALGIIRPLLSGAAKQAVIGELDRDYVKLPLHEIEAHLKRMHER